ncbi:hypothetical protein JCM18909_3086 [Cutibacterium acnes JCM 18909]|nr:hypothetical protein JCM18909_3086 [Cutibacterium acnes JCM 18909]
MSVTTTPISARATTPSPRLRRSPRLIVIGVLCACLGGLGELLPGTAPLMPTKFLS